VDGNESHEGRGFSDFAVLYRLHAQGDVLAEAFERSGIPFRRIGGEPILKNPRVREVLEVLRRDLKEPEGSDSPAPDGVRPPDGEREQSGFGAALRRIVQSLGFDPQEEALETLAIQAEGWAGDVSGFLNQMILRLDLDAFDPQAERVTLMTLHASKGLEFPVVFIAGCESGLLPYTPEGRPAMPVEEERRLFYVGLTRAKERVFLTRARSRNLFGRSRVQEASPFLRDIEDHVRNAATFARKLRLEKTVNQLNLF
jgi:DNA helicase-2/ATP-dependent DNA helicase PcrA